MVTSGELRAGGALVGDALGEGVSAVRDVHGAVAGRVFGALAASTLAPAATSVRLAHDAVAATAYAGSRLAHLAIPRLGATAAALLVRPEAPSLAAVPTGRRALGAVNGLWGDRVRRRYSALAVPLELRVDGAAVELTRAGVAAAYPGATRRLAVFVHGLCESEASWSLGAERRHGSGEVTYGSLLREELGITPVFVRYNTGRCIADNARELSDLLERLVELWPSPVDEIALVGHSMGGLVIRRACAAGVESGHRWPAVCRHVVSLGSPHLGARLERGVDTVATALGKLPETRPAARWLDSRSAGIKDLRYGVCADEDAHPEEDPEEFVRRRREEIAFLDHASYYFVAATLVRDQDHPIADWAAHWVGDLIVHLPSAAGSGEDRHLPFPADNGAHLTGLHHFDLLNHPAVYAQLRQWLVG